MSDLRHRRTPSSAANCSYTGTVMPLPDPAWRWKSKYDPARAAVKPHVPVEPLPERPKRRRRSIKARVVVFRPYSLRQHFFCQCPLCLPCSGEVRVTVFGRDAILDLCAACEAHKDAAITRREETP
jgi:hypothetical protein